MQSRFIKKWNAAIALLEAMPAYGPQKFIHLHTEGQCAGFSAALLAYGSREDLEAFYRYIDLISNQSPEAIAALLSSNDSKESQLANELFNFVSMLNTLQKNQMTKSASHHGPTRTSNIHRISSTAKAQITAEVLVNETSARKLLKRLSFNEGMLLGAEAHAYAIYRTENTWIIFDPNDSESGRSHEFTSIKAASRKLLKVLDENTESFALSKMSFPRETFQLIVNIFMQFINLFRREKRLLAPVALAATQIDFSNPTNPSESHAAVASKPNNSHTKIMQTIAGHSNAEVLANRAIETGDDKLLQELVKKHKLDINQPWQVLHGEKTNKAHPLVAAIISNNENIIDTLISLGADVNTQHHGNTSCLQLAIEENNPALVACLLKHADPNFTVEGQRSPLATAIAAGNNNIVQLLLQHNANPDQKDYTGVPPLLHAVSKNDAKSVELLLSKEANPNVSYQGKASPLTVAIHQKNSVLIEMLLENNADPNIKDDKGISPLIHAVISNNVENVNILLSHNANPHLLTNKGQSALDLANHYKNTEIAQLLSNQLKPASDNQPDNLTHSDTAAMVQVFG